MRLHYAQRDWLIVLLNSLAAIALCGFGPPKLVDREVAATIRLTPGELRQWHQAAQPPSLSADALLVYDVDAQRTLYSRDADAALPPASLTKLMTALLAFEEGRFDDEVEIAAEDLVDGAAMGLAAGDVVSVEELLWGLLVASGNDAAMALARKVGGDVDAFVDRMNSAAEQMGLNETQFANPHGLDADGHMTSARDMLAITLRLLEYPLFREIVGTAETVVAGYSLVNTNELLTSYPGADGVKTGTTELAGQCLVASISEDDHKLIVVVLGSDDRYADVANLHALYDANYDWVEGDITDLSVLNRLYGEDGRIVPLQAEGQPFTILVHRWGDPQLLSFRHIDRSDGRELQSYEPAGRVEWRVGDDLIGETELTVR